MNEDVKSENLRIHSRADELIACLEGEIAKRDEELAACRVAVENCELFRARIAELEDLVISLQCKAIESDDLRAELAALKAQEPVASVKHGPLDSDGWPEFARVETIGDFDLENLPSGMKLYAAPAAPAADAGLVEALEKLARLGNGDKYGNSDGNLIAQAALAAHSAKGVV